MLSRATRKTGEWGPDLYFGVFAFPCHGSTCGPKDHRSGSMWRHPQNAVYSGAVRLEWFENPEASDFVTTEQRGIRRYPLSSLSRYRPRSLSALRPSPLRQPDLRRCERIRWPRAIIENANDSVVKVWETTRRNERRVCLWLEEEEYLVVLAERQGYLLPWTAYMVTRSHRRLKFQEEFERWKRKEGQNS